MDGLSLLFTGHLDIRTFSELLAEIMPKYDQVLIIGDFNIHVCSPDKPQIKDFLNVINSFNFMTGGKMNKSGKRQTTGVVV